MLCFYLIISNYTVYKFLNAIYIYKCRYLHALNDFREACEKVAECHSLSVADDRVVALREVSIPPAAEVTMIIQVVHLLLLLLCLSFHNFTHILFDGVFLFRSSPPPLG